MNSVQILTEDSRTGHLLPSLEIRGFRVFRHLALENLGSINLIVGKNNVGKSCLLEALYLYAERGSPDVMLQLLDGRNEGLSRRYRSGAEEEKSTLPMKYLFYGRPNLTEIIEPIHIGPVGHEARTLSIEVAWYVENRTSEGPRLTRVEQPRGHATLFGDVEVDAIPRLLIGWGRTNSQVISLYERRYRYPSLGFDRTVDAMAVVYVPAGGLTNDQLSRMWDKITLTPLETDVVDALKIIHRGVEAVNIIAGERAVERTVIARLSRYDEPVPLRSLGEGMNRLFGMILALVSARDGILLIDEVESGLHYSVQLEIWRLIFRTAHMLNVQVFATTHSWDCIEAFQVAASEDAKQTGMLIRLQEQNGSIVPTLFDEQKLAIATRNQIEIR
jgi:hypothetical protein